MRVIFIVIVMVCFMCHVVCAQNGEVVQEQIIKEYEISDLEAESALEVEKVKAEGSVEKIVSLQSGTRLDIQTLNKINNCRSYAEIANLQSININLAIQRNNDTYNNIFKIWLALHGVVEVEFRDWVLNGNRAVLKKGGFNVREDAG